MRRAGPSVAIALVACVVGCASRHDDDSGLRHVRDSVKERGGYVVQWNTGSADDARAGESVRGLLSSRELTADDAVRVALLSNRRLQATFEELGVAQADLVQAGLLRNPIFSAEIKFAEGGGGTQLELAVVQEFLDVLQIPLRRRIAEGNFEAAKHRVTGAVLDLTGRVRAAFYVHQAATQTLEMRRNVAQATGLSFDFAKRLRDAGNITVLQLSREQALHEEAKVGLAGAEAEVLATLERLNGLMGLWGNDTRWTAASRLNNVPAAEVDVARIESRAVERSIDLAEARATVNSASDALGISRTFAFAGDQGVELGAAAEREPEGDWTVGPAVSVPIPLFDTGNARVARAQAEWRRARQTYFATAVEVRAAARAASD